MGFFKSSKDTSGLLFLGILVFFSTALFTLVGTLLAKLLFGGDIQITNYAIAMQDHRLVNYLKFMQLISATALFIIPTFIFGYINRDFWGIWNFNGRKTFNSTLAVALVMIVGMPFINWTAALNAQLHLPGFMSGMQAMMERMEKTSQLIQEGFMSSTSVKGLMLNIVMMAVIPAVGEELLFRGILQPIFHRYTKRIHLSIFITAFLFSAIHMQFLSFIPRFLMGMFFGYLFYMSKSLWLPMVGHFVNNFTAVMAYFLLNTGRIKDSPDTIANSASSWQLGMLSAMLVAGLVYVIYRDIKKSEGFSV